MKILVVDDEVPVRKYIVQMIRDCGEEYEVIASVGSVKAALEVLKGQVPDLIFADITMPKTSGLSLLEKVKETLPEVDVFMLTCHNDFEFARTAIKLQADNYILKDEISPAYMKNLLKTASEKRARTVKPALHRLQSDSYFIQLMESEDTLLFDSFDLEKHKIFLKDKEFVVVSVTSSPENLQRIIAFKSPLLQNQEIFPYQDSNIILVANTVSDSGKKVHDRVWEVIEALRREISGPVGVSSVYYRINMLRQAVLEAGNAYNLEFYKKVSGFSVKSGEKKDCRLEMQRYAAAAHSLAAEGKYKKLIELVQEICAFAQSQNADVFLLKKTLTSIVSGYQMESGINRDMTPLFSARNISEVLVYLEELSQVFAVKSVQYSEAVNDVIHYIETHFEENITLTEMADMVHLNQDYFSRRFKKETGAKFSDYLLQVRMEEAKRLLVTTKKTIAEIAGMIGFNNDSYFSATFKKFYGENPNEFRKNR